MRVRKNQKFLTDREKQDFIDTYQAVRAKAAAGIERPRLLEFVRAHDEATNNSNRPITHGTMFLSWHRAHLMAFEIRLRRENDHVTLPFWNAYRDPYPDWLLEIPNVSRPSNPGVDPSNLTAIPYSENNFSSFQNNLNGGYHIEVHNQLGGAMGTMGRANRDPVFWLHHNYIDRIWSNWIEEHWSETPGQNGQTDYLPANRNDLLPEEYQDDTQFSRDTNSMLFTPSMGYVFGAGIYRNLERKGTSAFNKTIKAGMIISVEANNYQAKILVNSINGLKINLKVRVYQNWIPIKDFDKTISRSHHWDISQSESDRLYTRSTNPKLKLLYFSISESPRSIVHKLTTKNGARAAVYKGGIEYMHLLP
jgi:tyrosinase-like protein